MPRKIAKIISLLFSTLCALYNERRKTGGGDSIELRLQLGTNSYCQKGCVSYEEMLCSVDWEWLWSFPVLRPPWLRSPLPWSLVGVTYTVTDAYKKTTTSGKVGGTASCTVSPTKNHYSTSDVRLNNRNGEVVATSGRAGVVKTLKSEATARQLLRTIAWGMAGGAA